MACMVEGCNFLLKAVTHEAFQYENGQMSFIDIDPCTVHPYLLVNIGSGVSMVRVDGEGKYQRISGTNMGGGTFWGLGRLLTGCSSFDDILELSSKGDNSQVDMLVGDIYGGRDYASIGLSANTIASSFGKVLHSDKELRDYDPADIAMSLCRMISYNIGQLAYLNAKRYNLSRIFFGGFFIRGHPYTMETISFAIRFWSQGEMGAMFLRHEGFLGAMGAFMRVQALRGFSPAKAGGSSTGEPGKVRARFVERFTLGHPALRESVDSRSNYQKTNKWVEKFIETVRPATEAAKSEHEEAVAAQRITRSRTHTYGADSSELCYPNKLNLHVGVLHFTPSCEPFPLLADAANYKDNTIDINKDAAEMAYWVGVLQDQIHIVMEKAASSDGNSVEAVKRAAAFGRSFDMYLSRYRSDSGSFGQMGLSDLFELREECLREAGFKDVYKLDKERENAAALEALPDLLSELDGLEPPARLLSLIQGALAANIFDWGAKACVDLYYSATILEMYRDAREKLSRRPWRVDDLDEFAESWLSKSDLARDHEPEAFKVPYKRALIFVDNAGADVVLGMIPLARELLRAGCEVVMAANSLPAINDITFSELKAVVSKASDICPIIKAARHAAVASQAANEGRVPPPPGMMPRPASLSNLSSLVNADDIFHVGDGSSENSRGDSPRMEGVGSVGIEEEDGQKPPASPVTKGMFGESYPSKWREPRFFIIPNGQGSPCLDLNRVSRDVADATVGTDLVIIEGMGRAIHTNFHVKLRCDVLKLAMIKNKHLAVKLFNGDVYDCVCRFDEAM